MRRSVVRRVTVSTLSEIAANHAKKAKALEVELAMASGKCSAVPYLFELPSPRASEQSTHRSFAPLADKISSMATLQPC